MRQCSECPRCGEDTFALADGLEEIDGIFYQRWECCECWYVDLVPFGLVSSETDTDDNLNLQ